LKLSDKNLKKFGGKLIDVGFPLNFIDGENRVNVMTGPMKRKQASQFLIKEKGLPRTGIFVGVDFFRKELEIGTRQKDILKFIDLGVEKARNIKRLINNLVLVETKKSSYDKR